MEKIQKEFNDSEQKVQLSLERLKMELKKTASTIFEDKKAHVQNSLSSSCTKHLFL